MLAEYDSVLPGLAERIVVMAEKEQEAHHALQNKRLGFVYRLQSRGQWLGLVSVGMYCAVAAVMAYAGAPWPAGVIVLASLASLAGAYMLGRKNDKRGQRSD